MFHFGHANALRQARSMGDILVVGIHPDEEVKRNKGPPVMNEDERLAVVKACKWVDEATLEAPYQTTLATLDKFNIDFCVHGEDISINSDGSDSFEEVKKAGRFKLIKRTDGVSTTDLVGRMLLLTKNHFDRSAADAARELPAPTKPIDAGLSSRTIFQFSEGKAPNEGDKIVYMDGGFDLFHAGHANALRQAKELGDYLIVGVHTDQDINHSRGENYPIMNLHERVLCVLSCRYVDEVVIGAPWVLTRDWIERWRLSLVVHGDERDQFHPAKEQDPYAVAKEMGIYQEVKSTPGLTTASIVQRVINNRIMYEKRNKDRAAKDAAYEQQHGKLKEPIDIPTHN